MQQTSENEQTLLYYDQHAENYIQQTINLSMKESYENFLHFLHPGDHILDAGCGSGRDSLYFLQKGYAVTALDGSKKIAHRASKLLRQKVLHCTFQNIQDCEIYDAIWANASLLHIPKNEITCCYKALYHSLKKNGIWFISFKYGDFEGMRNQRYFRHLNESSIKNEFHCLDHYKICKIWTENKPNGTWIQIILQKLSSEATT